MGDGYVFRLNLEETEAPVLYSRGVTNAASFASGDLSPGMIVTLFGARIGPREPAGPQLTPDGKVATTLAGVEVTIGAQPAPLLYASAQQVTAVVPYGVVADANGLVPAQLQYRSQRSNTVASLLHPASFAAFTSDGSGSGQAAMLNEDASVNRESNPASRGSVVVFYGTGEGLTTPTAGDGTISLMEPLAQPNLPVMVTIGGQPSEILYAGAAPGLVAGVIQLNVRVPGNAPAGRAVPVVIRVGNADNTVQRITMAVR
jgi:uncharacterized protein (TIGR03437 family)